MGIIEKQSVQDIANAIRNRNGLTTLYKPREMDEAILNLYSTTKVNSMLDYILPCYEKEATDYTIKYADSDRPGSISELQGNTTQNGTPTPTNPIPIYTVSGDNEVLVRGKNLFDKDDVENDKRLDSSGQPISSSASGFSLTNYIKVQPNTKYTLSRNITSSSYYVNICEYTSDKTHIQRLYKAGDTTTTFTFTTPSNCEYLRINDATTNLNSVQLEKRRNFYNLSSLYW